MPVQKRVNKILNIIFNAQVSVNSMGGGDKIVLSNAEVLQKQGFQINVYGSPEGIAMAEANIKNAGLHTINKFKTSNNFLKTYLLRIFFSFSILSKQVENNSIVWTASDFLPDVLPGLWLKLFKRDIFWIGNMFLRARNPFKKEVDRNFSTILFFISQNISLFIYKLFADRVCVLCNEDYQNISKLFGSSNKICLISGGIDTEYLDSIKANKDESYDACYIGRFHYQKGIPVLIKAWAEINKKLGTKVLAIIGWGNEHEESEIKRLISESGFEGSYKLLGFMDRDDKIKVLKSSSVLLFPSSFESWGVVIAEGLGCGVPIVAFDLKEIKQNFKEGVLWSQDFNDYVKNTSYLLVNTDKRKEISEKAYNFSKKLDWKYSAEKLINKINF